MLNQLTQAQIRQLPTLDEVIYYLKDCEWRFVHDFGGWLNYQSPFGWLVPDDFLFSPTKAYYNNANEDEFVVSRTKSGRTTLCPNLKTKPFLYRGQNRLYDKILSSFERLGIEEKLKYNLMTEDFVTLLRTHPIFMMFDRGIKLDGEEKVFFINMNYYGLAQHYGFMTAVVDFTSDIDVASFFACTRYLGNDQYEPITDTNEYPYGVVFVHRIDPHVTLKMCGFSTIGLQLYPRTGAQKGFLYNDTGYFPDVNELVSPLLFRHDAEVSRRIFERMKGGKLLFPDDNIAEHAREIQESNEVSGETYALNLYSNQEDAHINEKRLSELGFKINWHKRMLFTPDTLDTFYSDMKNGYWEVFCNQIFFGGKNGQQLKESLLNIPRNSDYSHFFLKNEWDRLQNYNLDLRNRAVANSHKK